MKNSVLRRSPLKVKLLFKMFLHFEVVVGVFYISSNICQVIKLSYPLQTPLCFRKRLRVVDLSAAAAHSNLCVLEKKKKKGTYLHLLLES